MKETIITTTTTIQQQIWTHARRFSQTSYLGLDRIQLLREKKTGLKDIDVAEVVLPKSTEDEDRNFYRSQTT